MEVLKFILANYGTAVAAVFVIVYLCFFIKKSVNGNEKKLKDDLATVLRENAELKVQLKKSMAELNKKVDDLNVEVGHLMEESERYESNNESSES